MKRGLDHLNEGKRRELDFVVGVLREGFARALKHRTQSRFRAGKLLKIILFGSYARGDWVDDPVGRYFSDYDLLVVVNHEDLTEIGEFWAATEDRLLDELASGTRLRTPVSLVYHSIEDVNEKLSLGRYFLSTSCVRAFSSSKSLGMRWLTRSNFRPRRRCERLKTTSPSGLKAR